MLLSGGAVAPISLSDSLPSTTTVTYGSSRGLSLVGYWADYGAIYRRQLWVAVLVNKVSNAVARLPLKTFVRADTGRLQVRDNPMAVLLRNPNPRHDPFYFWLWTASTFEIHGEAIWLKVRPRPDAAPRELWPIHPANVDVRRLTRQDEVEGLGAAGGLVYVLNPRVDERIIPASEIVHFRSYNPDNVIRGMSRLEPLRQTLVNEDASRRATSSFWQRGARPGFVLKHPGKFVDPGVSARLKAQFDAAHAGPDNAGGTLVLEEAMEAQRLDLTAEEAQYIDTRKLNREEACAIYDVPPPVVHLLERATFSNITEQMRSMYRDTMAPRINSYESTIDCQLRPDFGDDSLYAEFLMDEVLRGSMETRIQATATGIQTGQLTPAEAREMENRPFIEGSDKLFINAAVVPVEAAAAQAASTGEKELSPEEQATMLQKLYLSVGVVISAEEARDLMNRAGAKLTGSSPGAIEAATVRSVMGRLARVTSLSEADPGRLTNGLNGDSATVLSLYAAAISAGDDVPRFHDRLKAAAKETIT